MVAIDEGDRRGPRAGGAAQLRVGEDQRELAHAVARELRRVEVFRVDAPRIELTIAHGEPLSSAQVDEVRERVAWHLSLNDDLRSFYAMAAADPVLSASVAYN